MVRHPSVAGQFYEEITIRLRKQIEECFLAKFGPGRFPETRSTKKLKAVISPHAGYFFSGPCAAQAYMQVGESLFSDTYVILGPNHYGLTSGISTEDWITPLGLVENDLILSEEISKATGLSKAENCHNHEHSIEVQLPFLQFASKDRINDLRIVPIVIGQDADYEKIGKGLYEVIKKSSKEITIIISSDFTHFGSNYRYLPFKTDIPNNIRKLDTGAIDLIRKLDAKGFEDYADRTEITICGVMPILVYLSMVSHQKEKPKAELLCHYMSGEVIGDYKNSVSYVSIAFS